MKQRKQAGTTQDARKTSKDSSFIEENEAPPRSNSFSSSKRVFGLCLAMRVANSLLIQTYFNPDEHWQALEVAHRIVFGYGHLTWEWGEGIRSFLHPMVFAVLYKVLALLQLDTPLFIRKAPRILQALFSAIGDLYLYKLAQLLFDTNVANLALFSQLTNWFMFFCFNRTLSNSLETVLTIVGIYYWPCMRPLSRETRLGSRKLGLVIAAIACAIRPTSAIVWVYVGILELLTTKDKLKFIFLEMAPIGLLVLTLTLFLDRLMYGSWVLVPLNFLRFNFLSAGGDYYGTHKWHWYFTQGFSVMVFTFLPFSIAGIIGSKEWKLSGLIAWVIGLYSVLGHKEFRFVLPVLPIALMFSGYSIASIGKLEFAYGKRSVSTTSKKFPMKKKLAILFLLVTNIPMALYMSLVHQRGSEDVMNYLSDEAQKGNVGSILFLTPCHATPYYSTLHRNLPMRFLDCSPPREGNRIPDESDRFMMDPVSFTLDFFNHNSLPSHIVLFNSQEELLKDFLTSNSLEESKRFFHAHFKVDRDLQASIVVYALKHH
ncbi:mannosyltransferase APTG1 [Impatiens glandulifera]|uniref:mannosyltransferase APTG1 n=1 Tax=Impatiens glandulifera TaxID=253017 RepID=UPI001FB0B00F|nr:mannosyltransferase APTG1 [Impatiens glandulifera]